MIPYWILALASSNILIAVIENMNRKSEATNYLHQLPTTIVPILCAQFGLWYGWKYAPSMMLAWAVFTIGNSLCRIVNVTYFTSEGMNFTTLAGVGLMMAGVAFVKQGTQL